MSPENKCKPWEPARNGEPCSPWKTIVQQGTNLGYRSCEWIEAPSKILILVGEEVTAITIQQLQY
ncbi:MAG: hypothetical protein BTN85_1336 [Candidatus Methanohalarchaeum thermophilum]|uniref:Uncharacterized protein n=1 Tax=Methanohalarchaeum thermophilum TaxID=1903181 RepID=A0A1Q6DWU0_METT1|nr:MAG: hypothetical protein BTN85_1336 [Candidatus Methanohalarchaeum thermophilum]